MTKRILIVVVVLAAIGLALIWLPELMNTPDDPDRGDEMIEEAVGLDGKPSAPHPVLRAGFDSEFLVRSDGYPGLKKAYDFSFAREPMQLDPGLMYKAAADGQVDVICGFATDGRIPAYDLVILEDDKNFFPPYYAAPVVRRQTIENYPEVKQALDLLAGKLPNDVMRDLNYRIDEGGERPEAVARDWLAQEGLIPADAEAPDGAKGTVAVGSKAFTEQELLGEIMARIIEGRAGLKVNRRLNLGGTMICQNALRAGDLDLYAEYTGTGLMSVLGHEVIRDPEEAYDYVKQQYAERWGLIWLKPFGLNNAYTITMRREQAEQLGLKTIPDLAAYVRRNKARR